MLTLLPIQSKFVNSSAQEVLLSLPPAGGSTTALLSAALNAVQARGKWALLITKNPTDFRIISDFYTQYGAKIDKLRRIVRFPNDSIIMHGYIQHDEDVKRYIGCEFSFIGIESLHTMSDYVFFWLKTRLRNEPSLLRCTGSINAIRNINPQWIQPKDRRKKKYLNPQWNLKQHFVKNLTKTPPVVIDRKVRDNPYLDKELVKNLKRSGY